MDTKLPPAITQKVCKTIVCAVAITVVGLIWGIASHDAIVVGLTPAIAVAGGIKAWELYRTAKAHNYEVADGIVRDLKQNKFRKRTELLFEDQGGDVQRLILEGLHHLQVGAAYRLYLQKVTVDLTSVPEALLPGRTMLGYEMLDA